MIKTQKEVVIFILALTLSLTAAFGFARNKIQTSAMAVSRTTTLTFDAYDIEYRNHTRNRGELTVTINDVEVGNLPTVNTPEDNEVWLSCGPYEVQNLLNVGSNVLKMFQNSGSGSSNITNIKISQGSTLLVENKDNWLITQIHSVYIEFEVPSDDSGAPPSPI